MFPGPGAQIYRNEAGEPLGWDYPDAYEPDPHEDDRADALCEEMHESAQDAGYEAGLGGIDADASYGADVEASWRGQRRCPADAILLQGAYADGYADGSRSEDDET